MSPSNFNWIIILPILGGIAVATQTAINGQLRASVGSPLVAALLSFTVGTIVLVLLTLATKQHIPTLTELAQIDKYRLTGGMMGAFFITIVIISVQRMSVASLLSLVIAGQLITALVYDHFGLIGVKQSPITLTRLIGAIALIVGAYLINKK